MLLSGGLDSTVALAAATKEGPKPAEALFFDYGQHAAMRERQASERIAELYGCRFECVRLPWLKRESSSAIVAGKGRFPAQNTRLSREQSRAAWVENRNGIFIAIAAFFAAERGCETVIVGFNKEEARDFPDNSVEYLYRVNRELAIGTSRAVQVLSPTSRLTKRGIVLRGLELGIPWDLLWSCYLGGSRMCGSCQSCIRLRRAIAGTAAQGQILFGRK